MQQIDLEDGKLSLTFTYDAALKDRIKAIPGARFEKLPHPRWLLPVARLDDALRVMPKAWRGTSLAPLLREREELERWKRADDAPAPPEIHAPLFSFQRVGIQYLRWFKRVLLRDEMRMGKSRQAASWAVTRMKVKAGDCTICHGVLIVCPSTAKYFYRDEVKLCLPDASTFVVEGRTGTFPVKGQVEWVFVNWDLLAESEKYRVEGWPSRLEQIKAYGFSAVVFSEAHRAKAGQKSLRGQAMLELSEVIPNVLCETGTPIVNRPEEIIPILYALGKLDKKSEWKFKMRYCGATQICINPKAVKFKGAAPKMRWDFRGSSNLEELSAWIETFSIGRRRKDVMPDVKDFTYQFLPVEITNRSDYEAAEADMDEMIEELARDPYNRELRGKILGQRIKLLVLCATGKAGAARELLKEYEENNQKCVVFSEYLDALEYLGKAFKGSGVLMMGGETSKQRDARIHAFRENADFLFALASRKAYGETCDLSSADTVLFVSLPWGPKDFEQARDRITGPRQTSKPHCIVLLGRRTLDSMVTELIYGKNQVINAVFKNPDRAQEAARYQKWMEVLSGTD